MQLGINFIHDARQPIGFDADAARALRPGVVRFVVDDPSAIAGWVQSALSLRLRVLWCIPVERIGQAAARHVLNTILRYPDAAIAGFEIGDTAWSRAISPHEFLEMAQEIAQIAVVRGVWVRGRGRCPILLGGGYDATQEAWPWTLSLLEYVKVWPRARNVFSGLAVSSTRLGAPLPRRTFRWLNDWLEAYDWRIAFTRMGWPIGSPLSPWHQLRENWIEFKDNRCQPNWTREISRDVRDRWVLEAVVAAERPIGASHVFLDPEPDLTGMNRWACFDTLTGRVDPLWHGLTWHKQATLTAAGA